MKSFEQLNIELEKAKEQFYIKRYELEKAAKNKSLSSNHSVIYYDALFYFEKAEKEVKRIEGEKDAILIETARLAKIEIEKEEIASAQEIQKFVEEKQNNALTEIKEFEYLNLQQKEVVEKQLSEIEFSKIIANENKAHQQERAQLFLSLDWSKMKDWKDIPF
jgi:hypothetical protein